MTVAPGWVPDRSTLAATRIVRFAYWLVADGRADLRDVTDYAELQAWSAAHPEEFWAAVPTSSRSSGPPRPGYASPSAGCRARCGSPRGG